MKLWYGWKAHLKAGLWGILYAFFGYQVGSSLMPGWLKVIMIFAFLIVMAFKDIYPPFRCR